MRFIFLLVAAGILTGCIQQPDYPEKNYTKEQIQPFLDAGCREYEGDTLDCSGAPFGTLFGCFSGWVTLRPEGLYLDPQLVLAECNTPAFQKDLTEEEQKTYFYCRGGLLYSCVSYIVFDEGGFSQAKNHTELAAKIAPVGSREEALHYVLLSHYVIPEIENTSFKAKAESNPGGFLVSVYDYNRFGCYDHIDYEEVKYQVSRDGKMEEKSRAAVYTRKLDYAICVD